VVATSPTVRAALREAVAELAATGVDTPRLDAEVLLAAALETDRAGLFLEPGRVLPEEARRRFEAWVSRRAAREPVAHLLGRRGFRLIELGVDERVLVPRPETEDLVEVALDLPAGARVIDVGTGSGAIALALKHERPDLEVVATDASAAALAVAAANAARLGLEVRLARGDLLAGLDGPWDAVLSNPPYVPEPDRAGLPPEVRREPEGALFAGADGLAVIRRLIPAAARAAAATLTLEVGEGQAPAVAALARAAGFDRVEIRRDLAGTERVVVARW
jgi:release factor glutamine methyltransferase